MNYWSEFSSVAVINILAVMSPGPAFALVVANSFFYKKKSVFYTALGLGAGVALHVINALVGIGYIIAQSSALFTLVKYIGAMYLIFVGYKSLTDKIIKAGHISTHKPLENHNNYFAFKKGFITNATNPKALVFFLSLYTVVVSTSTPLTLKFLYGLEMVFAEFIWFFLVGYVISHDRIQLRIGKFQDAVVRIMGCVLIFYGVRIFFS